MGRKISPANACAASNTRGARCVCKPIRKRLFFRRKPVYHRNNSRAASSFPDWAFGRSVGRQHISDRCVMQTYKAIRLVPWFVSHQGETEIIRRFDKTISLCRERVGGDKAPIVSPLKARWPAAVEKREALCPTKHPRLR